MITASHSRGRRLLSRRTFAATGLSAAIAGIAAGCSGSSNSNNRTASPSATVAARAATGAASSAPSGTPAAARTGSPVVAAPATTAAAQPRKGGDLLAGQVSDPTFNSGFPFVLLPQNNFPSYAVSEPLIRYRDSLQPDLVLVDSFNYSQDRTTLTATLKPGLTFHNGAPVTTDDVFFGVKLLGAPSQYGINGALQLTPFAKQIKDMKATDARTMGFSFDAAPPNMNDFFAQLCVTQASGYDKLKSGQDVQGTGPYRFTSWSPGQGFRLDPNPTWHRSAASGGGPFLSSIQVKIFADQDSMGLAFQSGSLDMVLGTTGAVGARFRDQKLTRVAPKVGILYLACNVSNPALADKRLRQALFMSLDRQRLVTEVAEGFGSVTAQPWPSTSPAYDKALDAPFFDTAKAKDLLKQAGFTQDAALSLEYQGANVGAEAAVIQTNLAAAGVKIELKPLDNNAFIAKALNGGFSDMSIGMNAFANLSPLTMLQQAVAYQIPNSYHYDTPLYEDIRKQLGTLDPLGDPAKAQYQRFNQMWLDDPWLIPFEPYLRVDLVADKVQGMDHYFVSLSQSPDFGSIWKKA